jgi:hypothetical protein
MSIGRNAAIAVGAAVVVGLGAVGVARATSGPGATAAAVTHPAAAHRLVAVRRPAGPRIRIARRRVARFLHRVTNAQATVSVAGKEHTVRLDHGVVRSAGDGQIVLAEAGSQTVTVPVMSAAIVKLDGRLVSLGSIPAGDVAYVVRVDGNAARGVRAFGPNSAP